MRNKAFIGGKSEKNGKKGNDPKFTESSAINVMQVYYKLLKNHDEAMSRKESKAAKVSKVSEESKVRKAIKVDKMREKGKVTIVREVNRVSEEGKASKTSKVVKVNKVAKASKVKKGESRYLDYIYDGDDREEHPKKLPKSDEMLSKTLEYIKQNADHCAYLLTIKRQLYIYDMRDKNVFMFFFASKPSPKKRSRSYYAGKVLQSTASGKKSLNLKKLSFTSKGFEVQEVTEDLRCKELSGMVSICGSIYIFDAVDKMTEVQRIDTSSGQSHSIRPIPSASIVVTTNKNRYIIVKDYLEFPYGDTKFCMWLLDVLDEESGWAKSPKCDLYSCAYQLEMN